MMQKHLQHLLIFMCIPVFFYRCGCHLTLLKVTKIFHGAETELIHDSERVKETAGLSNLTRQLEIIPIVTLLLLVKMVN